MKLNSILICLFLTLGLQAQQIKVVGTVKEAGSQQPVPYAAVALKSSSDQTVLTGATTDDNGHFELMSPSSEILVEITFMGFKTKTIKNISVKNNNIDLGIILLEEDAQQLDEVVVEGEVSQTVFKLDKRVFNIGKDLSNTGVGALDVLSNVPSVNVSIEGTISLRGSSGVEILINGKPSVLASEEGNALGTITSDMIESIEVITNPSAKYNAEGTSGIINIILKKDDRQGTNGSVTLNTGIPNNHSLGLSINRRSEKFNLFSQLGVGRRTRPRETEMESVDTSSNSVVTSKGDGDKNETFVNFTLGTDYIINDNNMITLSGNYAFEKEDENYSTLFNTYENDELTSTYDRRENVTADNPKYQFEFNYNKDFDRDEDQKLIFSALGNFFGKDQSSQFDNLYSFGTIEDTQQQTTTDFKESEYTFKLDYTHPINDIHSIETGAQYILDDVSNDYAISNLENGEFVIDEDLSNVFNFTQNVLAFYGTYAYEKEKWGVKLGARIENTHVNTLLENTNEENTKDYTNLFPSAHTSYKFSDNVSLQAGYSKRIYRPRLWDLNPFLNIQNQYSLRSGNPNLNPEYTDSYEITNIYKIGKLSLNIGAYFRHTDDVIERIVTYEGNVSTSMPANIGTNDAFGAELNAKYVPTKWLTLSLDGNYNSYSRKGTYNTQVFDFDADQYTTKLQTKLKLPADVDLEFSGNYNSSYETIQGEQSGTWFMDAGLRKKIFKGKAIANLSVRDVFASRIQETYTYQTDFYQRNWSKRGRFVTFGISFGFGKGEAMEFSSGKRH
ncbi:Outer membrane receptor proteins, mostly Fe transport [Pustulibacterium marinum]|uniref:Outer membrane receptor proteins, mostly Fe transport n=1 Tax=Pustulibacterium marinum TaxID=1224947 RepID=A0A1I7IMK1_9FLAO|nr:outer membrane beta-barrel family protein [Pustulibacterium marinum]SFU74160.1 Outer membrane receptor proteins, mostly Fe transport [Pustulibacterium marinum]